MLQDWGNYVPVSKSYEWYIMLSNHNMLPFPGSWEDQPRYVQRELIQWTNLERWHELNEGIPDAPLSMKFDDLGKYG